MDAYAAGKTVQFQVPSGEGEWMTATHGGLGFFTDKGFAYRIKPEEEKRWMRVRPHFSLTYTAHSEWYENANLELTFEDGELVDAKVLK
jgi:hypothetical protein